MRHRLLAPSHLSGRTGPSRVGFRAFLLLLTLLLGVAETDAIPATLLGSGEKSESSVGDYCRIRREVHVERRLAECEPDPIAADAPRAGRCVAAPSPPLPDITAGPPGEHGRRLRIRARAPGASRELDPSVPPRTPVVA